MLAAPEQTFDKLCDRAPITQLREEVPGKETAEHMQKEKKNTLRIKGNLQIAKLQFRITKL